MPVGTRSLKEMTGREKAAVLLISMGPEKSAKVFKHLKEEEIEGITLEIANTSIVSPDTKEDIMQEFYQLCVAQQYITEGGIGYAKQLLEEALGPDKAFEVISKLTVSLQVRPFDFIRKTDAGQILNFIQNEHPQTIALILSYLKPKQAADVLVNLAADKQADVTRRIAVMNRASPEIIKEVERALEKRLSTLMTEDFAAIGGVDAVVDILNSVDRTTEKNILEQLETEDVDLAEEIKLKMFVFEDITVLSNRDMQLVLRQDIDNKDLAIALKGSSPDVQEFVFGNLSKRLGSMIREDMDYMGPLRKSDVEEAQQKIVNVIRKLQDSGEIIVARGGGDDLIV